MTGEAIRGFVLGELEWPGSPAELTDELPLIASGAVDSLGLVMLVSFVQERFGIDVGPEDVVPRNFGTIGALCAFVAARREDGAAERRAEGADAPR